MIALLIYRYNKTCSTIDVIRFTSPIILFVAFQIFSMYGLDAKELLIGSYKEVSVVEWYKFIYAQDPDDLSILYHLKSQPGLWYFLFQLFGLYLAAQTEGIKRIGCLIRHPIISICFACYTYLIVAALIEVFQIPDLILEKVIILQPRRIAYIPVLILCVFIIRYIFEFFWNKENVSIKYSVTLFGFLSWFSFSIYTTNDQNTISAQTTYVFFAAAAVIIILNKMYHKYIEHRGSANILRNSSFLFATVFMLLFLRMAPYATADTLSSIRLTYFSVEPRSYIDYFLLEKQLNGNERYANNILGAVNWMKAHTTKEDNFLSMDLGSNEIGYFSAFANRRFIQSLDLRHYRGPGMGGSMFATNYDVKSYQFIRQYFEKLLDTSMELIITEIQYEREKLDGSVPVNPIQKIVSSFSTDELKEKRSIYGKHFDYVLSKTQMTNFPKPTYDNESIFIYKLRKE
jgi:hypothetical protein